MDILETQVSDLRSFLTHPAAAAGPGSGTPVAGGPTAISPRHPSAHPGSPLSAPGDNSALASPFASGSGGGAGFGARNGAGKRKADGDDGSGKTQRSKRNRVCVCNCPCLGQRPCLDAAHYLLTLLTYNAQYSTSRSHGMCNPLILDLYSTRYRI